MSAFSPIDKSDYERAVDICEEWLNDHSSSRECRGRRLIDTLENITDGYALSSDDTTPFGNLLSDVKGRRSHSSYESAFSACKQP